ncbi:MAG: sulfite exporter TauE/SafE family protein [Formosimonas sp.]
MDFIWLAYPLLGCAVGFLAGLLGIGGGLLSVPILLLIMQAQGMHHPELHKIALATSTTAICFTAFSSMRSHWTHNNVNWWVVKHLLPGIIFGTLVGALLVRHLPVTPLRVIFVAFTFYTAYSMLANRLPKPSRTFPKSPIMFAVGHVIGTVSTLISAGGGFISVPFMLWCNVNARLAIGTSAALGFPIAVSAVLGYILTGFSIPNLPPMTFAYIYMPAVLGIVVTSALFAPIGAKMAQRWDVKTLKKIFAVLLIVLGLHMMYTMGRA